MIRIFQIGQRKKCVRIAESIAALLYCTVFFRLILGKADYAALRSWYMVSLGIGMMFMPLTAAIFPGFKDKGWIFSKILAILFTGYLTWVLGTVFHIRFSRLTCFVVLLFCFAGNLILAARTGYDRKIDMKRMVFEELLFLGVFLFWVYLIGFNPDAYGTEKFMDYGIVQSMVHSEELPPEDIWYAGETLNYYYGGQYFTAFLSKLTGLPVEMTYNLMRAFIPAVMFVCVFLLVGQMIGDKVRGAVAGGIISAVCCVFAGNGHYIIYRIMVPALDTLFVRNSKAYWFPDSTRYIGYNPEVPGDYTIHEFPAYSFILGDLHAHMINIIFVILLLAVLYVYLKNKKRGPALITGAFLVGMFQWTNYWDFVIYSVVIGITVFTRNIIQEKGNWKGLLLDGLVVFAGAILVPLPFNSTFQSIYKGVGVAEHHTPLYQFFILWGIPVATVLLFIGILAWEIYKKIKEKRARNNISIISRLDRADIYIFLLSGCALGLILIPEIVYVRDIYEASSARANTMFKLTYQAFILFSVCSGYIFIRALSTKIQRKKQVRIIVGGLLFLQLLTVGYSANGIKSWFHGFPAPEARKGLDATGFLDTDEFIEDKKAVLYLRKNVKDGVVLEAHGPSYSGFGRVSVVTGLPTVAGWYTHEWLWRDDTELLNERIADVETIYTSEDPEEIKDLIEKYQISYIFYGTKEMEKYAGDNLSVLKEIGDIEYEDEDTVIFKRKDNLSESVVKPLASAMGSVKQCAV